MKTGTLNRITEAKNDFVPLVYVAEEIGCPLSDVFCVCIEGAVPLYVQCLDDIVDQTGVNTGRSFWVNCRVPDLIVRELVRCTEISVEQELLLAGTMTPNGSESWAQSLLIQCGPGRYTFKPANRDVTIRKRSLGVMELHMDLVRAAIEQRTAKVESKMDAGDGKSEQDAASMEEEYACLEKFTLHWLGKRLREDVSLYNDAYRALTRAEKQRPDLVMRLVSSNPPPIALVKYWLEIGDLPCYMKGLRATFPLPKPGQVDLDALLDRHVLKAGDPDEEVEIQRAALVQLYEKDGLLVPKFLRPAKGVPAKVPEVDGCLRYPASEEDMRLMSEIAGQEQERKQSGYYTIDEIVAALLLAYGGTPEDVFRPQIMRGIEKGELRLYDPRGWRLRAEYHSKVRRSYYELIHVPELNRWFDEVKQMLCQIEFESDFVTDKSSERFNHDQDWQRQANEIAAELMKSNRGRVPTKGKVATELAKRLSETAETVERRIRKQW